MRRRTMQLSVAGLALAAGLWAIGCGSWSPPDPPPVSGLPAAPDPHENEGTTPPASAPPAAASEAPTQAASSTPAAPKTTVVVGKDACKTDADCVPATCCVPEACVAASKAPKCDNVRCMRDCSKPNTVCGGGCLCQNGLCAARLGTAQ